MKTNSPSPTQKGAWGESRAVHFLEEHGYEIIARNVRFGKGEIDIVTIKNGVNRFVEVKSGKGFEPVYNITPKKLLKLIQTVQGWRKMKKLSTPFCLDAVIISDNGIRLIENITL